MSTGCSACPATGQAREAPVSFDGSGPPVYAAPRMGTKPRKGKVAAAQVRPRRPALGNDPFERGAAARVAPLPPLPAPPVVDVAHPVPRDGGAPAHVAARLEQLESRIDDSLGNAEARLAELARQTGPATYAEELRELLVRLLPALRDRLRPLASLAKLFAAPRGLDRYGMDARLARGRSAAARLPLRVLVEGGRSRSRPAARWPGGRRGEPRGRPPLGRPRAAARDRAGSGRPGAQAPSRRLRPVAPSRRDPGGENWEP